jgi:hypothetical protein
MERSLPASQATAAYSSQYVVRQFYSLFSSVSASFRSPMPVCSPADPQVPSLGITSQTVTEELWERAHSETEEREASEHTLQVMVYAIVSFMIPKNAVVVLSLLLTYLANGIGGHCNGAMNSKGILT